MAYSMARKSAKRRRSSNGWMKLSGKIKLRNKCGCPALDALIAGVNESEIKQNSLLIQASAAAERRNSLATAIRPWVKFRTQ